MQVKNEEKASYNLISLDIKVAICYNYIVEKRVSFLLISSVEKSSEKQKIGTQEEAYIQDEEVIADIITFITFAISSLLLAGEIFRVFVIILMTFIGTFA